MRPPKTIYLALIAMLIGPTGCSSLEQPSANPPDPSRDAFAQEIYPMLLRDCGFPACHGDSGRFLRIHGPGRNRLDPDTGLNEPPTEAEIQLAYDRSRSMLASASSPEESLLLRKPLELDLGGAAHLGTDRNGRDVYGTAAEGSPYYLLYQWASGQPVPRGPNPQPEPEPEDAGVPVDGDVPDGGLVDGDGGVVGDADGGV